MLELRTKLVSVEVVVLVSVELIAVAVMKGDVVNHFGKR